MNKWKVIAPLGLLAAAGAAAALLLTKKDAPDAAKSAPADKKKAAPQEKMMKTGEYSFVSGFKDAKTVEVRLDYDALRFGFDVIGEDFLCYSSDSHVALITGEDFSMQMEYASYYKGEDFSYLAGAAETKYSGFAPVSFNGVKGIRYRAKSLVLPVGRKALKIICGSSHARCGIGISAAGHKLLAAQIIRLDIVALLGGVKLVNLVVCLHGSRVVTVVQRYESHVAVDLVSPLGGVVTVDVCRERSRVFIEVE